MPTIDFSLNVFSLSIIILTAMLIGFVCRSRQLKKKQIKISELRREMINNHAYILELQKEFIKLELKLNGPQTLVLPININTKDHKEDNQRMTGVS
jgi:predicted RNase H-like nuclease (RuvC/YqgF family)